MASLNYFVITFVLISSGPAIHGSSMPESKQAYLISLVTNPLQIRQPALNDVWRQVFYHMQYVSEICSERFHTKTNGEKGHGNLAPCGRLKVVCIPPNHGRCKASQMIITNLHFQVNITFTSFNISNSFSHCRLQSLQILYQRSKQSFVKYFCGMRMPWSEYAKSNNITLLYESKVVFRAHVSGIYEVIEPGEISDTQTVGIFSVYAVNNTISHPFTGDGMTHLRGIETQTFHIYGKLYNVILLWAFHDYFGADALFDIKGFDGPSSYSRPLSRTHSQFHVPQSL